ncbi:MAG: CRISPR-associated endonuclease Cas1 [Haliscomenobacter sp.]|nr:CRISPR-associated endonuclease Cas1 [Haliscomenobacter sp.]
MQLVLDTKGLALTRKGGSFLVESEKGKRLISAAKLTSIAITAYVMIGSDAIQLAIHRQIPILFFDRTGKAQARLWSPYFASIATLRRQQVRFAELPEASAWMADIFLMKAEGQADNLQYLKSKAGLLHLELGGAIAGIRKQSRQLDNFREKLLEECRQQMMGVEGAMARMYWPALGGALPSRYAFQTRSRRPAKDIFNAALNYLYGMLYGVVEGAVFAAGLDPHLGLLHADEYDKPTLSYDLIEPFRPWIDRLLIDLCLEGKLKDAHFTRNQFGIFLNKTGKELLIPAFNDYLRSTRKYFNQESSVKNHMFYLAGRMASRIRATAE